MCSISLWHEPTNTWQKIKTSYLYRFLIDFPDGCQELVELTLNPCQLSGFGSGGQENLLSKEDGVFWRPFIRGPGYATTRNVDVNFGYTTRVEKVKLTAESLANQPRKLQFYGTLDGKSYSLLTEVNCHFFLYHTFYIWAKINIKFAISLIVQSFLILIIGIITPIMQAQSSTRIDNYTQINAQ